MGPGGVRPRGRLSFTGISQPWLARAAKAWASEELPRHRGGGAAKVREKVNAWPGCRKACAPATTTASHPAVWGAGHRGLPHRLAYLESTGTISRYHRNVICRDIRAVLPGSAPSG